MKNRFPIYVISKSRPNRQLTATALSKMNADFFVVVEPQEANQYQETLPGGNLLVLPFSDVGSSVPARNWVWEHSIETGHQRHWILDDNIEDFNRLNKNIKRIVRTTSMFRAAEDFIERYENVALSGFNYHGLCKDRDCLPPFVLNTRIYSCILIDNSIQHRWRGTYNEDTDLSLRCLKDGYCTILFNAFLAGKVTTMRMKGGNTDDLYSGDGRKKMAESLKKQHPDCVEVVWKFGRWHHQVDYRRFKKNKLVRTAGVHFENKINEYGMVLGTVR